MRRDGSGKREGGRVVRCGILQHRAAHGQRAGLVEQDGVDLGQAFHRRTVFHHDAAFEQAPRGHHLHHRDREPKRTGAGDDEHGDRNRHRLMHIAACDHPAHEAEERGGMHHRGIKRGRAVRQAAIGGTPALSRFHQANHFGQEGILRGRNGGDGERTGEVERPGAQAPARAHIFRRAFTGGERNVDVRTAIAHHRVNRHAPTRR